MQIFYFLERAWEIAYEVGLVTFIFLVAGVVGAAIYIWRHKL